MVREPLTRWARLIAVAACVVAMLATVVPAYAAPAASAAFSKELAAKQSQVDDLNAKLDDLDRDAEIAAEEYNKATVQLQQTTAQLDTAQNDLNNTRAALVIQDEILAKRLANIYRDGNLTAFEVLLDSKSVGDFIGRVKFLNTISTSDANKAAGLKAQKDAHGEAAPAAAGRPGPGPGARVRAQGARGRGQLRIAEQQQLLDSVQADVRELLDAEAAKRDGPAGRAAPAGALRREQVGHRRHSRQPGRDRARLPRRALPLGRRIAVRRSTARASCSYVFAQHGVTLPHYSGFQFLRGEKIPVSQIQPNDVVFFGSPVHHVGIYVGGGYFIHAPKRNDFVKISKLADRSDIAGVRRYPWVTRTAPIKGAKSSTGGALNSVR